MTQQEFDTLAQEWNDATGHFSTTHHINKHQVYDTFLNAGVDVIPFIIDAMEKTLNTENTYYNKFSMGMFQLLCEITGCQPIAKHNAGRVRNMMQSWVTWYHSIYSIKS